MTSHVPTSGAGPAPHGSPASLAAPGPRHPEHVPARQLQQPRRPDQAPAEHHGVGHIVEPKVLIVTCLGLLVLTFITVAARWIDLGAGNIYIALVIAVIKASLVALFFMHLWWDRPFNGIVLVASIGFVALFIGFALTDTFEYQPDLIQADPPAIQQKLDALPRE